MITYSELDFCY